MGKFIVKATYHDCTKTLCKRKNNPEYSEFKLSGTPVVFENEQNAQEVVLFLVNQFAEVIKTMKNNDLEEIDIMPLEVPFFYSKI
jgi:hypothetical protein